jgi:predicted phage terminase large subunit-like protein
MESEEYSRVFKTKLVDKSSNKKRTQSFFQLEGHDGYNYSVGVGGATVGKSADIFLIDDPFKGPKEAFSKTIRQAIIDWFTSVAETRLSLNGHIILMHQRWHKGDLAGHILEAMEGSGEEWEVFNFPAVCEEPKHPLDPRDIGDPLWPEFKGDSGVWAKMERKAGPYFWNSIYQQNPTGQSAALVKKEHFRFYDPDEKDFSHMEQGHSWDMNFKSAKEQAKGSYVVGQHWANDGRDYYILGQRRGKWGFQDTTVQFEKLWRDAPVSEIFVEDKANGPAIIDTFKGVLPCDIIPVEPMGDKFGRFAAVTPLFHDGRVWLPHPDKVELDEDGRNWVRDFMAELLDFPNGDNDDQVDSCSQYLSSKWDPVNEGLFTTYSPTSKSKWGIGGKGIQRPKF